MDNYAKLITDNLNRLQERSIKDLARELPAKIEEDQITFNAFGHKCRMSSQGIFLDEKPETGVLGILISLYALKTDPQAQILEPFKAFKEFPDSMPYAGAFVSHTESILVPHVPRIQAAQPSIFKALGGFENDTAASGDFSFIVRPLPKICLCYIFYHADEDFPASVTCLYSNNALQFMPIDGLADVGEYTSRKILELVSS